MTDRLNGLTTSVAVKAPVRVATTAAISASGLQTIDGITLAAGDRVLRKDEPIATNNGIWIVSAGDWTRAADFDGTFDVVGGTQVYIISGEINGSSYWRVSGSGSKQPGVDPISFVTISGTTTLASDLASNAAGKGASLVALPTGTVNDALGYAVFADMFRQGGDAGDDALPLQRAIDAVSTSGGGTVILWAREYVWLTAVEMKSGVTVWCAPGARIDVNAAPSPALTFTGTAAAEIALTVAAGVNTTQLTLAASTGLAAGDLIQLISVRNALSRADAGNWWLGDGTASLPYAYFAEWNFLAEDLGANSWRLAKPLIFPSYATTAAAETETERTTSAIRKITPLRDAHWEGGRFIADAGGASLITGEYAHQCTVEACIIERGDIFGSSLQWLVSFECEGKNVLHKNDTTLTWDYNTMHGQMNRFKTVGSQDCGFVDCKDSFGAQSVDFTYGGDYPYANVRSYCRNGFFRGCFEGLTSHPSCYKESWINNDILDCYTDAIVIRGYEPVCELNRITGKQDLTSETGAEETAGIVLAYGATRRGAISFNTVTGFYSAFEIRESSTLEWYYDNMLVNITGNAVDRCFVGLRTITIDTGAGKGAHRLLTYANNRHSLMGRFIAELDSYTAGVTISGNTLDGGFRYNGAGAYVAFVSAGENCPALIVKNNEWRRTKGSNAGLTSYMVTAAGITDTATFPKASWAAQSVVENNEIDFAEIDGVIERSISTIGYIQARYMHGEDQLVTIAAGAVEVLPMRERLFFAQVDTEAAAATDDLDRILPYTNSVFRKGDVLWLKSSSSARDIVLRDATTSGAASYGIQTAGNASVTLNSSNDIAQLVFTGTHWSVASVTTTL